MTNPGGRGPVDELLRLYQEELRKPFPYADARTVLDAAGAGHERFIPDLSTYFSDVAGHCAAARKMLGWSQDKLLRSQRYLSTSFFEKHPAYRPLEREIRGSGAPALESALAAHEQARRALLLLVGGLVARDDGSERAPGDSS